MKRLVCALLVATFPIVSGCGGDDPVGPIASGPMQLSITGIAPSDIEAGVIDRNVSITTAAANLWPSYVRLVSDLCGRDPVGFSINSLAMSLDFEESLNVSQLEEVFDGTVTIYLTAGGATVEIGTGLVSGAGPVTLQGVSTEEALAVLYTQMLAGTFQVGLRAETSRTAEDDFSLDVEVSFLTRASCQ